VAAGASDQRSARAVLLKLRRFSPIWTVCLSDDQACEKPSMANGTGVVRRTSWRHLWGRQLRLHPPFWAAS